MEPEIYAGELAIELEEVMMTVLFVTVGIGSTPHPSPRAFLAK
jgi:hypothetical protein